MSAPSKEAMEAAKKIDREAVFGESFTTADAVEQIAVIIDYCFAPLRARVEELGKENERLGNKKCGLGYATNDELQRTFNQTEIILNQQARIAALEREIATLEITVINATQNATLLSPWIADGVKTGADMLAVRERYGMSQQLFADWIGVRQATVSDWETGRVEPSRLACVAVNALQWRKRAESEADAVAALESQMAEAKKSLEDAREAKNRYKKACMRLASENLSESEKAYAKLTAARQAVDALIPFATAYRSHPKRNPDDKLEDALTTARAAGIK